MEEKNKKARMKVAIVGGVAGGASCAARLWRLDEEVEILMVERGPYVSYANYGLPYHVGGVIEKERRTAQGRHRRSDARALRQTRAVDRAEGALPQVRRASAGRPGDRRGWCDKRISALAIALPMGATRALPQNGFKARTISGGMLSRVVLAMS